MNYRALSVLTLLTLSTSLTRAQFNPAGYALSFNGANNYVNVSLSSPPASNYTLTAWVYLRTGGAYSGSRQAVLSSPACGGSIELLIRSSTANAADPQYVELGRCNFFNGFTNTLPVPLNTWTHLAVTVSSNYTVSYFVNGTAAGSFTDTNTAHSYALGSSVDLGDNANRRFDGMLDEVQIWSRALSAAEVKANRNRSLTGSENGLYAYYRFDEGSGGSTVDSAAAGGGSSGTLVNSPAWVSSGVQVLAPAQITLAGIQTNLGSGWRTSSPVKALDIDGDSVLGTDGYYLINRPYMLPGYVSGGSVVGSYPGNANYASLDDPTNLASMFTSGTLNPLPGKGTNGFIFSFTLNANAVGRRIRVGLMVDNLDSAAFNASGFSVVQLYGNEATNGVVTAGVAQLNDRVPDWVFFDIANGADGDVFQIYGAGGLNGTATLGAVVWDSQPTTLVVSNLSDAGPGSLRAQLATAPAGATIAFAPALSGQTLYLTNGPLVPTNTVTINASALAGGLTLSGGGTNELMSVAAGANVTLVGLTFSQGSAADTGGAIYSFPGSSLHIVRCTFSGNTGFEGGAILNDGSLSMENTTMTGNAAGYGGALQCRAPAVLTHCTLVANAAYNGGGGVWNKGASLTLNNCIVAGNTPAVIGADIYSQSAALVLQNANLIQVATNDNPAATTGPAPLTNAPLLAALGNYGGPTQTMPPLAASPAIDAGRPTPLMLDQRGLPRAIGPAADLGAVEFYTNNPVIASTADSGGGSLRSGLNHALPGTSNTVTFAPGLSGQTIVLTNGALVVDRLVTIDGSALANGLLLNGNSHSMVLLVNGGVTATLVGLTLTNGYDAGGQYAGGLANFGTLTVERCTIAGNVEPFSAGGVWNIGSLTMNDCTVAGNVAQGGYGGGVQNDGTLTLNHCTLTGNTAGGGADGGGIWNRGTLVANQSTFTANYASTSGGAVDAYPGSTNFLLNCTLVANTAGNSGGGLHSSARVALENCVVAQNTAGAGAPDLFTNGAATPIGGFTNFIGDGAFSGLVNGVNGNLVGNAATPLDPRLAALGSYGGWTQTMPPLGGSPVIDAGNDAAAAGLATDQRGYPRLRGAHVDIGAVELTPGTIVTSAADSGPGSLRGVLAATSGADLISFAPNLAGKTIFLTSGALTLAQSLSLDASGLPGGMRLNGSSNSPILVVQSGVAAALNELTFTNGYDASGLYAGGLANDGTLNLTNCLLAGNGGADGAGGIYNSGILSVNTSTLAGNWARQGNGGGVYNDGTLALSRSTLSGNALANGNGGGIWNDGTLTLDNSTVAANGANTNSGASGRPEHAGHGGGIWNVGWLALNQCTVVGNTATLSGGGVEAFGGQTALTNSIVAGNSAPAGTDISGSWVGQNNVTNGNPLLSALGNYHGPTQTMPPLVGSPAINAGDPAAGAAFATDQRGLPRLAGPKVDIGAVEFQTNAQVLNNSDSGEYSLRAAVAYGPPSATITFALNLSGQTILLTNGELVLSNQVTVDASALANGLQIDGHHSSRIFTVQSGATVVLRSLTLTNGYAAAADGGAIYCAGNLALTNCALLGSTSDGGNGGGLRIVAGDVTLDHCVVSGNSTTNVGGGVVNSGLLTVNATVFSGNQAQGFGGGVFNDNTLTLNNCLLTANHASDGAGCFCYGLVTANNTTLWTNVAASQGGGIVNVATMSLNQLTLVGNTGGYGAGGLYSQSPLTMNQCTVVGNSSTSYGGGLLVNGGVTSVTNSIIAANSAASGSNILGAYVSANNLTDGNPLLGPLGYYGGFAPTLPPLAGSPAIDAGTDAVLSFLSTDQRGAPRLAGAHVDLGAVEVQSAGAAPVVTGGTWVTSGSPPVPNFQLSFTNLQYGSFTVFASTNVAAPGIAWSNLGLAVEVPPGSGQFRFSDPQAAGFGQRFYRLRSP